MIKPWSPINSKVRYKNAKLTPQLHLPEAVTSATNIYSIISLPSKSKHADTSDCGFVGF